ncbi:cysteine synthase [Rhodotorula diobovata]|uniref:cystathionine beta-synthase n=1 Tax=Rhodotorula diobovata TaxID=5288 RepID=A0A5C5G6E4_9BASI|nr:cysteine synthase [Rhodotorula diobovata]
MSSYTPIQPPIHDNALSLVGHTPLVRLDRIARKEGLECNLLAKVEGFSAGGSVKDRIALRMVEEAEKDGRLIPGHSVLVEPTSGNTGIGLALVAAVKGYRCIITMPEKMSKEKSNTLKALGAEIYRTPTEAAWDSPESHISLAKRIVETTPGAVMLDQYNNPANPDAHYHHTAAEILTAVSSVPSTPQRPSSGTVDMIVAGAGTGGTLSGLSKRLREANPALVSLGVDPVGSILARPESLNVLKEGESSIYKVEGTGYDFVPAVLSHDAVTLWIKSSDDLSFATCKRLIRTEGLLVGGSSGASVGAALQWLKSDEGFAKIGGVKGKNVVVVLPDSLRNYITSSWLNDDEPAPVDAAKTAGATPQQDLGDVSTASRTSGLATPPI